MSKTITVSEADIRAMGAVKVTLHGTDPVDNLAGKEAFDRLFAGLGMNRQASPVTVNVQAAEPLASIEGQQIQIPEGALAARIVDVMRPERQRPGRPRKRAV